MGKQLQRLLKSIDGTDNLLILPHNNPDPDAIASSVALRYLLEKTGNSKCEIGYRGIIGRAENKALVRYLDHPLHRLTNLDLRSISTVAMVDTQPGAGNNARPEQASVAIVIDHHPKCESIVEIDFADVRPNVGSTASIMVEYLRSAGLKIEPALATALFYGIKTDTMGLGRGTSRMDMDAICYLLPRIDLEALLKIERVQVPVEYFKSFSLALQSTKIYENVVVSYLGSMSYPDLTAEMADFLLRMKGSRWIICMGFHKDRFIISIRTQNQRGAGELVQKIVGKEGVAGGHGSMAGGQVILEDREPQHLNELFTRRALALLDIPAGVTGVALV